MPLPSIRREPVKAPPKAFRSRHDGATFMRQWQTEAIILGGQGAAETNAAASIPDEAPVAPFGLRVVILAHR